MSEKKDVIVAEDHCDSENVDGNNINASDVATKEKLLKARNIAKRLLEAEIFRPPQRQDDENDDPVDVVDLFSTKVLTWKEKRIAQKMLRPERQVKEKHEYRPYSCDKCDSTFKDSKGLYQHKNVVHAKHRNFECEKCDKKFKIKSHLKSHMATHAQRDIPCDQCDRFFTSKVGLNQHMLFKHSDERPFSCKLCTTRCKTRSNLKKHVRDVHTDQPKPKPEYECKHCYAKYKSQVSIKRHQCPVIETALIMGLHSQGLWD